MNRVAQGPGPGDDRPPTGLGPLVQAVQTNFHIADARHATDLTLCTYLLQMREFFRWERRAGFEAPLSRAEVGGWIAEREALWESLEQQPWLPLPDPAGGQPADPFDADAVNAWLEPMGFVYGAGLVGAARPVFFLARRESTANRDGLAVVVAGEELARGLLAPPATLGGEPPTIQLRRESLERGCRQKHEAYAMQRRAGGAFLEVVRAYGLEQDFDAGLERWVDELLETMTLHEVGEHRIGLQLGPGWARLRMDVTDRRTDLGLRAVRDHLADLEATLPALLAGARDGRPAPLHAWFAEFDGPRQLLFPSLLPAYERWHRQQDGQALQRAVALGRTHFDALARRLLGLHAQQGAAAAGAIRAALDAPEAVCPA